MWFIHCLAISVVLWAGATMYFAIRCERRGS